MWGRGEVKEERGRGGSDLSWGMGGQPGREGPAAQWPQSRAGYVVQSSLGSVLGGGGTLLGCGCLFSHSKWPMSTLAPSWRVRARRLPE